MNASQTPEEAVKPFIFSSPEGHALCHCILKEYLPYDPHNVQIEGFCKILDNIDLFAVLATRSDKTSFLSMYILVVLAIKKDPSLCTAANFLHNPCILVICPTKYLEHQMVGAFNRQFQRDKTHSQQASIMEKFNPQALVINSDTIQEARKQGFQSIRNNKLLTASMGCHC
jgi:hypothetical protein